jgi:hypothetical protein
MKPSAYQSIDVQFPTNGTHKPKQRKKAEKAMQL